MTDKASRNIRKLSMRRALWQAQRLSPQRGLTASPDSLAPVSESDGALPLLDDGLFYATQTSENT